MGSETEFIIDLIEVVREEEIIYLKSHPSYMNKAERNKTWERIGKRLGTTKEDCEKRWKLLREKFGKTLRKAQDCAARRGGEEYCVTWPYYEHMMFLKDHRKRRNRRTRSQIETVLLSSRNNSKFKHDKKSEDEEGHDEDSIQADKETDLNNESPTTQRRESAAPIEEDEQHVVGAFKKAIQAFTASIIKTDAGEDDDEEQEDAVFAQNIVAMMKPFPIIEKDALKNRIFDLITAERRKLFTNGHNY